jgi:uncharacterized membrane protein YedE/YeeE
MLKVFVTAVATSSVIFAILAKLFPQRLEMAQNRYPKQSAFSTFCGAAILGAGMAIAGACPGTVAVQVGMGVHNAVWGIFGGLLGAISYAFVFPYIENWLVRGAPQEIQIAKILGVSYQNAVLVLSVLTALFVSALEYFVPWKTQYPPVVSNSIDTKDIWHSTVWNPELSGFIVGILQFPAVIAVGAGLGSATSYVSVWVQAFRATGSCPSPAQKYLKFFEGGFAKWWQIVYLSCAAIGSYIASSLSSASELSAINAISGVPIPYAFAGGFLMVFGSRMASGCTSGHGLSGMPLMISNSFLAVVGMFASGMLTANILRNLNSLPFY